MKEAVILAKPNKLISKVKIYILAVLNSPDLIKKTSWLKSYSLPKPNNSQICQFPFKILIFSKGSVLGLFLRLFGGPDWKLVIQTISKLCPVPRYFYPGCPRTLLGHVLMLGTQLPPQLVNSGFLCP